MGNEPVDIDDLEVEHDSESEGEDNVSDITNTNTDSSDENNMQVTTDKTDESDGEDLTLGEVAERMNIGGHLYHHGAAEDSGQATDQVAARETDAGEKLAKKNK